MRKVYETVEAGQVDPDTEQASVYGKLFLVELDESDIWDMLSCISSRLLELDAVKFPGLRGIAVKKYNFLADLVEAKHWEDL